MTPHEVVPTSNFRLHRIEIVSRAAKWVCLAVVIYDLGFFLLRTTFANLFNSHAFQSDNLAVLVLGMFLLQAGIWVWYRKMLRLPAFHDRGKLVGIIIVVEIALWVGFWNLGKFPPLTPAIPFNQSKWHWFFSILYELVTAYWFWKLGRLFRFYEQGLIFATATIRCIKLLGLVCIIGWVLGTGSSFMAPPPHNVVPRLATPPPGATVVSVSSHVHYMGFFSFDFGTGVNFGPFVIGIIIVLAAWIMEEGRQIQEEQELTV